MGSHNPNLLGYGNSQGSDITEGIVKWTTPKGNELVGFFDSIGISDRTLYDLKTSKAASYKRTYGASEKDILQTQIYFTILAKRYGVNLEGIKLIYLGLGDKDCVEIEVPMTDQTKLINEKTDELSEAFRNKIPPKADPIAKWECDFCPFSEDCDSKIR